MYNERKNIGGDNRMVVDSNLPVDRDRLKNRLIRLVQEDEEITSCFFGGSIGSRTEDLYSDIDARVVVTEGVDFKRKQQDIIKAVGECLFIDTFELTHSVSHYATFIKLDLFIYTEDMLSPSIWLKEIEIVKDNGYVQLLMEESQPMFYLVSQEEFDRVLNKYYGNYFEIYRTVRRDEPNHLEFLTLALKQALVSMWYMEKGYPPNGYLEWSKYEGERSALSHLETEFLSTYTPCAVEDLIVFMKKIELLLLEASEKVATYHNLSFSRETFKKVHQRISLEEE